MEILKHPGMNKITSPENFRNKHTGMRFDHKERHKFFKASVRTAEDRQAYIEFPARKDFLHNRPIKDKFRMLTQSAVKRLMDETKTKFRSNTPEKSVKQRIDAFIGEGVGEIPCKIIYHKLSIKPNPEMTIDQVNQEIADRKKYIEDNMITVIHGSLAEQIKEAQRIKKSGIKKSKYAELMDKETQYFKDHVFLNTNARRALIINFPAGKIINPRTGIIENQLNDDGTIGKWSKELFLEQFQSKVREPK